jgi:ATP-binding cassette subfamily C protein LapB
MTAAENLNALMWAIIRLAKTQGAPIDMLRLNAALSKEARAGAAAGIDQLNRVCTFLGLQKPKKLHAPDPVALPFICLRSSGGWGVVIDRYANGLWLVVTDKGARQVPFEELEDSCATMDLASSDTVADALEPEKKETFRAHIKRILAQYRGTLFEAAIASVFMGLLALATSLFSMQVYDRVIPTHGVYTLVILSSGVALSILIELAMKFARTHIMDSVVVGLDATLSREIFQRLLNLRVDQLPPSVGSLASQIKGYEQVRGFYTSSTLFALVDIPMALAFIVIIAVIASPFVALVPLVFGLIAFGLGLSIRHKVMALAKSGAALSNMKTGLLVESVDGVETIKAGSGGWKFLSRWIEINALTIKSDIKMRNATDSIGHLAGTISQLSYAGIVVVGALVVIDGHMTMGALIACSILSGRVMAPILALPGLLVQHSHSEAALAGLEKLYELKVDNHEVRIPFVPAVVAGHYQLSDVKFSYGDHPPAIMVERLEIKAGERVAILGPIGAGKSTLLRLLSGLYHPTAGTILLDGLDMSYISRQVVSREVGYLQQDHRLFQGTLRENLLIGLPDPGDEAIHAAMKRTGMLGFVSSHPKGMERPIMEGGRGLSGGQKQLVAFTRLILCAPRVLLLDEPTATMDEDQERRNIAVLAEEANKGKGMIIVTHKPSLLPLVERVIVIVGNKIVLDGPKADVLKRIGEPAAMPVVAPAATPPGRPVGPAAIA